MPLVYHPLTPTHNVLRLVLHITPQPIHHSEIVRERNRPLGCHWDVTTDGIVEGYCAKFDPEEGESSGD